MTHENISNTYRNLNILCILYKTFRNFISTVMISICHGFIDTLIMVNLSFSFEANNHFVASTLKQTTIKI